MLRVLLPSFLVCLVAAGCGGSSWTNAVARQYGGGWGDPKAHVARFETAELANGVKVDVLELGGHFRLLGNMCARGHSCISHPKLIQVALYDVAGHPLLSAGNVDTPASLAAIVRARAAKAVFNGFPDFSGLIVACNVPPPLVRHAVAGGCTTRWSPRRVSFVAAWPLSRAPGTRHVAGWVVRLGAEMAACSATGSTGTGHPTLGTSYFVITTGVPSGSSFASRVIAAFEIRMQPWLTLVPSPAGSSVPCSPISPGPPPKW